ncbi:putative basic-leucine zipper domain-containing protein [Septoria linicola]|nr:putative basic-leucine zipper domain-containing protein [Septoria linicola]
MTSRPQLKTEQLDMDSFFDFSGQGSPTAPSNGRADAMSPFDKEEQQQFNGPSHDYGQFKQQVGLPVGSLANMPQSGMYDGFNSGIDSDFNNNSGFGWNSGLDMDSDMGMDFNSQHSMFYPTEGPSGNFVDPNSIGGQEPASNVGRLWPGMHSQQAQQVAMQKAAQAQAMHQRQMKIQAQQAQYRQAGNTAQSSQGPAQQAHGKRASHVTEPHVEESISRLLNQMRQNNAGGSEDSGSPSDALPHIARMKKDEEEMDEDERLLASEEGKKLSSKERRQLRNKVSARAFRSRRKEYIGQLEGEVAMKAQESNNLRQENQALMQENERYRGLIETLLRHPAFTPFINDISNDPSALVNSQIKSRPQQQQQQQQQQSAVHPTPTLQPSQTQPQPTQQDMKQEFLNFDASQIQIPQPQAEQQQVNLAMIPEENFSKLNINGYQQSMNFNNFNQVNAYAVTNLPSPDVVNLLSASPAYLPYSASSTATDSDLAVLLSKLDRAARKVTMV